MSLQVKNSSLNVTKEGKQPRNNTYCKRYLNIIGVSCINLAFLLKVLFAAGVRKLS